MRIVDVLITHFPRQNEMGDLFCACLAYVDTVQDAYMAERWANHVMGARDIEDRRA